MNASQFVLLGLVIIPVVLLMVLRINAALVFLSLCLGDVLVQFVSDDAGSILGAIGIHLGSQSVKLLLLAIPVVLTTIFMVKTVQGSRLLLNILPAAGVGLVGALLVIPLLPPGTAENIINSSLWQQVRNAQDMIVGLSALLCLFALWLQRPKAGSHRSKKHH